MLRLVSCALLLLVTASAISATAVPLVNILDSSDTFKAWLCEGSDTCPTADADFMDFLQKVVTRADQTKREHHALFAIRSETAEEKETRKALVEALLAPSGNMLKREALGGDRKKKAIIDAVKNFGKDPNGYWGFVPKLLVSSMMGGAAAQTVDSSCYPGAQLSVSVGAFTLDTTTGDASYDVTLTVPPNASTPMFCINRFFFASARGSAVIEVPPKDSTVTTLTQTITVKNATSSEVWDMRTNGVNLFRYKKSKLDIIIDAIDTASLFLPFVTHNLSPQTAAKNVEYYNSFARTVPPITDRKYKGIVTINDTTDVHPGDVFFQSDMDGVGPTEAIAANSQSGHVAIAVRNETDGMLMVCESTTPNIRCTEYSEWLYLAQVHSGIAKATVVVPLKKEFRDSFNNSKAWEFAVNHIGLRYGFTNFFFGWVDTPNHNYPCLPDSFDTCVTWEIAKFAFYKLEEIADGALKTFVLYGLNNRLNVTQVPPKKYYPLAEVLEKAHKEQNLTGSELIATKERDSFRYPTLYKGKPVVARSMVCSTFTCFTLREAGIFDSINGDLECTEQTPWNIAQMELFDTSLLGPNRPAACITADPNNNLCQLTGNWTFHLNVSTMPIRKQMGNECASRNPLYKHKKHC